jgi:hypothetical protein
MNKLNDTQDEYLNELIGMALAGGEAESNGIFCDAVDLIIEPVGNDDDTTKALVDFMATVTPGNDPTLLQLQLNQTAVNNLFNSMAYYLTKNV